jgi:hypothetical protein
VRLDWFKAIFVSAVVAWSSIFFNDQAIAAPQFDTEFSSVPLGFWKNVIVFDESKEGNAVSVEGFYFAPIIEGSRYVSSALPGSDSGSPRISAFGQDKIKIIANGSDSVIDGPEKFLGGTLAGVFPDNASADDIPAVFLYKGGLNTINLHVSANLRPSDTARFAESKPKKNRSDAAQYDGENSSPRHGRLGTIVFQLPERLAAWDIPIFMLGIVLIGFGCGGAIVYTANRFDTFRGDVASGVIGIPCGFALCLVWGYLLFGLLPAYVGG